MNLFLLDKNIDTNEIHTSSTYLIVPLITNIAHEQCFVELKELSTSHC